MIRTTNSQGGAGDYPFRFLLKRCSRTTEQTTGDRPKTYTDAGYLWGSIDQQSAIETDDYGATRHVVSAVITLRNYPDVAPQDRLYWVRYGELYTVDGIRQGNNELIIDASLSEGIE